jgi:hypothetical protein
MNKKLNTYSIIEYDNKSLKDYKAKHFHYDKVKYGLTNLQQSDSDDLEQELGVTCVKLVHYGTYLQATNVQNYLIAAYRTTVKNFARNFIRNSKMDYMDHKELCDFLNSHNWDSEENRAFYWDWDSLQGLTEMEQSVMALKANGFFHEEIKKITKYNGTLSGLRNVYERARKKVLAKYQLLAQK